MNKTTPTELKLTQHLYPKKVWEAKDTKLVELKFNQLTIVYEIWKMYNPWIGFTR